MKELPVILCVDDEEIVLRRLQREFNDALDNAYILEIAEGETMRWHCLMS